MLQLSIFIFAEDWEKVLNFERQAELFSNSEIEVEDLSYKRTRVAPDRFRKGTDTESDFEGDG